MKAVADNGIVIKELKEEKKKTMNLTLMGVIGLILLLVIIVATGFWVSSGGKPYNVGIFTLHKLLTIGAVIVLAIVTVKTARSTGLSGYELTGVIVSGVFFLGTVVSGGVVSIDKVMPAIFLRMHQILPYLTTVSTGITLFLMK